MNAPTAAAPRLGPDRGAIDAIVAGTHGDPFTVLGPHEHAGRTEVRAFLPRAGRVWAVGPSGGEPLVELERMHPHGFFSGAMPNGSAGGYRLRIESGDTFEIDDPYRFPPILGEMDVYLLAEGRHLRLFEKLGAHPRAIDGIEGTAFTVWAPDARRVSVVGPFNDWDGRRHVMRKRVECGVWEMFIPGLGRGEVYKFEIVGSSGELLPLKADPMAFRAEHPPATASVIEGPAGFSWADEAWMQRRHQANALTAPITIYECHLGSWMRVPEDGDRYLSYDELADRLVAYVKEMSFTHIQLMPVSEFPFDGSWGYQPISLYAPTSRHGDPAAFARMVERFHAEGIGVMVDWVPGHFPTDAHGLGRFDGTALYEHADPRKGFHQDWNTLIYNYGRNEVANFLHANALYWLERFHIDGLRVDAVASMLYLDYSRKADEWVPNQFGGRENLEAVAFLRRMNELAFGENPGATTVAEESTSWPSVSRPTYLGGLGFGYKWNMGWMHDTLNYMSKASVHRKFHQNDLTFGLLYAFSENFVLPLSHDEVVHGKGSLLNKMPGDRWQKFANLRAYFGFMWGHPGKKLLFMGCEFGQEREWNHDRSLDWHLIDDPMHGGLQRLVRDLNRVYRAIGALHERDCDHTGFEWIDASDSEQSVVSFLRKGADPSKYVVVVCNFTPVVREGYRVGVPRGGAHAEVINTDFEGYGGGKVSDGHTIEAEPMSWHGREFSLRVTLPPLATVFLQSP